MQFKPLNHLNTPEFSSKVNEGEIAAESSPDFQSVLESAVKNLLNDIGISRQVRKIKQARKRITRAQTIGYHDLVYTTQVNSVFCAV